MNGHLDVVPPGPEDMWTSSPFEPRIKDGWMYGRGSGDMKAGVAAMTTALRAVMESGFGLGADVVLETVIEEENSGNGALACRAAGYDARAVLIPEPFGPTILTAQLGVLWFKVIVQGRPTHVLQTGSGANAIEKCVPVIHSLRCLEEAMNQEPKPGPWSDMAHPVNLNVGRITGGDWPSTVPAKAQFEARLSFYPGQDYESVAQRIRESVVQAARQDPWLAGNPPRVEFFGFRSQGHMVENRPEPFQVLGACHQSLKGDRPESYVAACTTDLRSFFLHGPARGTCFGPVAENIHGLDERVLLESVVHTARVYALFLARWCKLIS
jgi:acetylornithine deacetylase